MRIINLIEERNHYLEKFYSINEVQLEQFALKNFEGLECFYQSREGILEIISYIDSEIERINIEGPFELNLEEKNKIKGSLRVKKEFVNRILEQDFQILSYIDKEKSSIIKELSDLKSGRRAISGYKSKNVFKRIDEAV